VKSTGRNAKSGGQHSQSEGMKSEEQSRREDYLGSLIRNMGRREERTV